MNILEQIFKKYELTATHSDVIKASQMISPCKALDLGCGLGRNTLYLNNLGFDMTAVDHNEESIQKLNMIIANESLKDISTSSYDINEAQIAENFDFIFSTVVFMFLTRERIPHIINNMQEKTNTNGYNLIVSAMSTNDYPCHQNFPFTFKENELKTYYQEWQIINYNEDVGELHRLDEHGQRIKLQFATLLAQKR